ncbi:GIY-YIG nuclease family protein [Elizabethkingia ursingii]
MEGFFVYMFLDKDETPLYIGRSINLIKRVEKQHFLSQYGNLSDECLQLTKKVLYHECLSSEDMKIKERYLINTLEPYYNDKLNNKNRFSFTIDINWKYFSVNKEHILEKKRTRNSKLTRVTGDDTRVYEDKLKVITDKCEDYREYFREAVGDAEFERALENNPSMFNHKYKLLCINNDLYIYGNGTLRYESEIDKCHKKKVQFITGKYIVKIDKEVNFIKYDVMKSNKYINESLVRKIDKEFIKFKKEAGLATVKDINIEIKTTGTKSNKIQKASIPCHYKNDYVKGKDHFGQIYLLFKINGENFIYFDNFYLDFIYKKKPQKGCKHFDEKGINELGLIGTDYLEVEITQFKDSDFVCNFWEPGQKEDAEEFGHPIIYESSDPSCQCEYGFFYLYKFNLVKYDSVKKNKLISQDHIDKIDSDLLKISFIDSM